MTTPEVRYAKTRDGTSLAYQVFGRGRLDLVYVPGQISHLDVNWEWPSYAQFLRALGEIARVIVLDRRGIGLSDRLSPGEFPPAEVIAEDLGVVLDASEASRQTVLLGAAEGGQLCALYAASHPERVRALILYGMAPVDPEAIGLATDWLQSWEEYFERAERLWGSPEMALFDVREVAPSLSDDGDAIAWAAKLNRCALSPGTVEPLFRGSTALDIRNILPSIAVPTLVLHRTIDPVVPVEIARQVAATIPGAEIQELPGEDHLQFVGAWQQIVDAVASFTGKLGGTASIPTRRLATVMFTDIVGSTAKAASLGDAEWRGLISEHDEVTRPRSFG